MTEEIMIEVSIKFADGSFQSFEKDISFYKRYKSLLLEGLVGKDLVHELLTDDWGPPPIAV